MNNYKDLILKAKNFYKNKNFSEAKSHLILALKNNQIDKSLKLSIYVLISDICYKLNDFENAEKYLLKSIYQDKSNSDIYNSLGNIYLKRRDYKNAEKSYLKSINLDKKNETSLINLAILYHNLGKQKEAISFYKKVIEVNPKNIGALYNLFNIDKSVLNKKIIQTLNNEIKEKNKSNFNLASCYFLLANVEREKENFKQEINFLEKANNYSFQENDNLNKQNNEYWLNIIPKKFDKINYIKKNDHSHELESTFPIFIVGLPRCGSTLIESIISSGKTKVENLGETNLVNWAFLNSNKDFLKTSKNLGIKDKIEINFDLTIDKFISVIKNLNLRKKDKKIFFSEKSLENFFYIELILNIYPNAKFINPYRNLIDNTFAIYKQFLSNISWSHSLDDILSYIDNYLIITDFFKSKYPDKIFSFSLEDFTKKPRELSIQIYNFCNLEWDEKCLEFHKRNDLFSSSASNSQIRKSVQKYDLKKYESYKELLEPFKKKYNWIN